MFEAIFIISLFFILFLVLGFIEAHGFYWSLLFTSILFYLDLHILSGYYSLTIWPIFFVIVAVLNVRIIRRSVLTRALILRLKNIMPPMSLTEKEAIEAGDSYFEADLFTGKPDWNKLLNIPHAKLSDEEQLFIDNQVETLCTMLNDWKIVHEDYDLSPETWDYLKQEKFFGLIIPKEYGGLAFSAYAHSCIVTKISSRSITAAVTVMVPNSLGPAELLMLYGTEQQKDHYLPRLSSGEDIPCFALTAPEAGSDAGSIVDYGVVCKGQFNGEEVLGIRLNFNKRYITLAPIATVIGLAFKLYDPDKLIGDKYNLGITVCLIPKDTENLETGKRHFPLDLGFMNGPVRGHDVFVPMDYVIGGQDMLGQGWRMLMECLSIGRGISLPALSSGISQMLYRTTGSYSRVRKQFKTSIGKFEGVEEALARIGAYTYLMEATRRFTVSALDNGVKPAIASAITKCHLTEKGREVVNDTMDIHGGRGIMLGKNNYAGRAYQAIPISITVEGANILTRNLIIFGQGSIRSHPYLLNEMMALSEPTKWSSVVKFDENFFAHIKYAIGSKVRTFVYGCTNAFFVKVPSAGNIKYYYRSLTWMSSALAFVSDVTLATLGGSLKRKERISARLGDVLSYLYIASATIKMYQEQGYREDSRDYVIWTLDYCLHNIQDAFKYIFLNYPSKFIGKCLGCIVFPKGAPFNKPSDDLDHKIAKKILQVKI